jgi:hypothetical protein
MGKRFFSSLRRPKRLWGPPIQCVPGMLPRKWSDRGVKQTTHLHLVPRSRISGAIPPPYVFIAAFLIN